MLLHRLTEELSLPYHIAGHTIRISASIGYTVYPFDQGSMHTLIEHADQTLYKAKLDGKKTFRMYEIGREGWRDEKTEQLYAIRQALSENEFALYLQPKVSMCTGELVGYEALIRWQHPEKGLLFPQQFLPLINGSSLEIQMGSGSSGRRCGSFSNGRLKAVFRISALISQHITWAAMVFCRVWGS